MSTIPRGRVAFATITLFFALVSAAFADPHETPIEGRVFASNGGKYFLILSPVGDNWLWTMYKVDDRGLFKEEWTRDGTYARRIFVADDGIHVACMETWPVGRPQKSTPLIAIYKENELVKAVRLGDLIADLEPLPTTVSRYEWLDKEHQPFIRGQDLLLKTVTGIPYVITLTNGTISGGVENERVR